MKMMIENVRGSYAHLAEPWAAGVGEEPRYSLSCLIPKDGPQAAQLREACVQVARDRWPSATRKDIQSGRIRLPLRDGGERADDPAYEGCVFFNARSRSRPGVLTPAKQPATDDQIAEGCYSGRYYHVSVTLYAYDVSGNRGVGVGLSNVMMAADGERLDGRASALSDFAAVDAVSPSEPEPEPEPDAEGYDDGSDGIPW